MATKKTPKASRAAKSTGPKTAQRARAPRAADKTPARTATLAKTPRTASAERAHAAQRRAAAPPINCPRRAIFIDVENTSSEDTLTEVLESLKIDRAAHSIELTAVGNWRAVGQRLARHLASLGAQLVHSAPALGVRDWSDLWIAVAAGCWLGRSAPGDILEIISNDRAFDAVGDAAAARGVIYHRLQHRRGVVAAARAAESPPPAKRRSRGGRRRRRGGRAEHPQPAAAAPARVPAAVTAAGYAAIEPHGASRQQMINVIDRLTGGDPGRWVNLDVLEKALKAEGFSRPPGSPRLVTRLRTLKEVEVDSHGRVHVVAGAVISAPPAAAVEAPPSAESAEADSDKPSPPKRRRRRRSKASSSAESAAAPADA